MDDGPAEYYFQVQRGIYMLPFIFPEIELVSNEFISNHHLSLFSILFKIFEETWEIEGRVCLFLNLRIFNGSTKMYLCVS